MVLVLLWGWGCGDDADPAVDGGALQDGGIASDGGALTDAGSVAVDAGTDAGVAEVDAGPMDAGRPADPLVPDIAYCSQVQASSWMPSWTTAEDEVLRLVNEARARGANCGSEGSFSPTGPLTMQPQLRCAARVHSRDMVERDFFSHSDPDGNGPGHRVDQSGYRWRTWGENIAGSYPTPEAAVNAWLDSDGHCANMLNPSFEHIGVGHFGQGWTQVFGAER